MAAIVECYAGYRSEQEPRRFLADEAWIEVAEVTGRWHEPGRRGFRVVGNDGRRYRLVHDEESDGWSVERIGLAY